MSELELTDSMKPCKAIILGLSLLIISVSLNAQITQKRDEIFIRDPFILANEQDHTYYMYSSSYSLDVMPNKRNGIVVYKSKDLNNWNGPYPAYEMGQDFWADTKHRSWAPEVHKIENNYYLFASFTDDRVKLEQADGKDYAVKRFSQILVSNSPMGPFEPLGKKPQTPQDWMSIDGTPYFENGKKYLVFCHEWVQIRIGTINYVQLSGDFSKAKGKPVLMFMADQAKWTKYLTNIGDKKYEGIITDGPWLYKTKSGELLMLWSSFSRSGYAVGIARSKSGLLRGPWLQDEKPLFESDGGHPMIFKTFEGKMVMSLHQPNSGKIRARLYEIIETDKTLKIVGEYE